MKSLRKICLAIAMALAMIGLMPSAAQAYTMVRYGSCRDAPYTWLAGVYTYENYPGTGKWSTVTSIRVFWDPSVGAQYGTPHMAVSVRDGNDHTVWSGTTSARSYRDFYPNVQASFEYYVRVRATISNSSGTFFGCTIYRDLGL